ncbi:AraC family transcriptional regulator [Luteibacter rhizovicinus]|uniref:AraC family transcriptional regulator n=1 Tax=Luteibacter rhizovicinus TaxID=242606 RepID=A0A4R3YSI6_9GAMM|nr:AraC family transcriptional regulator [Luteibacter rhizovicinus]TCV95867.1 AraC family transcriptional regulator [Luteibacter rhizovicinus]
MAAAEKALWFIETHFATDISLADVATATGVSQYHLSRLFQATTGWSVMKYMRARRLSEAAQALASGARDILDLALSSGYGSHEAFTRAFRDQFGMPPEAVRLRASCADLPLVSAVRGGAQPDWPVETPRVEVSGALLIAGNAGRYNKSTGAGIPAQWQKLNLSADGPLLEGRVTYGVCCNDDDEGNFEYVAGFEVPSFTDVGNRAHIRVPARRYAVVRHAGHISSIHRTWQAMLSVALPDAGLELADGPSFERYAPDFDGRTGVGEVEIWLPLVP